MFRTFPELTDAEKESVIIQRMTDTVRMLVETGMTETGDADLDHAIAQAAAATARNRTPWAYGEILARYGEGPIRAWATEDCEDALYVAQDAPLIIRV